MMSNKKQLKVFNVCVTGLSGYDIQEKQLFGVGKSCLCNRLVRPAQDDYDTDHNSIFSTSDFVGSVLNNDHFLYWGKTEKKFDEHTKVFFKIIEQTELIDDESYLSLSKGGQLLPYAKRASATKLLSPGKLMYISRDQVALQSEFEQVQMDGDGKFQVDGFICVYDVSSKMAQKMNYVDLQEEVLSNLLSLITKTKKPVVIVATKCDDLDNTVLQRAQQFVHQRKLQTPIVECSADEVVNIDLILQTLWHSTETKNKFRPKVISYQEGLQIRKEVVNKYDKLYFSLVKSAATDSSLLMSWNDFKALKENTDAYQEYIAACGSVKARTIFNQQAKKIRRHYEDKKLNEFLNKLPDALDELLPTIQSIEANDWKWENCQRAIKNHLLFNKWFQILPAGISWTSPDKLFDTSDSRIPFDVLQVERSRACFDRHYKKLRESAKKIRMKSEFKKVLELTTAIIPGTSWPDATQIISGEESYKYLDDMERKVIFENYLREITDRAKNDFQELLFESASKFSKLSKDARPSEAEMKEIYDYLQDDDRYKNLENLGNARDIQLFNHIALMQSPNRCLSGPEKCMDRLIQDVVKLTESRHENPYENEIFRQNEDELINLLVIGKNGLGRELEERIRIESSCDELEYLIDGQIYDLNVKVYEAEDDKGSEQNLTNVINEFKPQGYMMIFSTTDSLEYIRICLKHIEDYEHATHTVLPLIILLGNEAGTPESEIRYLRNQGHNMANSLQCIFVDYPYTVSLMDDRVHSSQVEDAMRGIIDVIHKRVRSPDTNSVLDDEHCDIKILVCVMCGDDYSVELILSSMLQQNNCYSNPDKQDTIMLETVIDGASKKIAVTLGSYHRAFSLKNQIFHGFILVYSSTRSASYETLGAYASSLPRHVPMQMLAVTGSSSGASILFHEPNTTLHDDSKFSDKLNAKLLPQSSQSQAGAFLNFFNNVWEQKGTTELILHGIKKRRKEPLPDLPKSEDDILRNGSLVDDGLYSVIKAIPDRSYIETARRNSFVESDSYPSSPDHTQAFKGKIRSRASTCDSIRDYNNDVEGLYAKVDKYNKFNYIKSNDKISSDDLDDEDDMIWQENAAYESNSNFGEDVLPICHLKSATISDRPYATVPFTPKSHKSMAKDHEKYNTLPHDWSKHEGREPTYESIEKIKASIIAKKENYGFENDNGSSISSKSKDSMGSLHDLNEKSSGRDLKKSPTSRWFWQDVENKEKTEKTAPIAEPEDDSEVNDEINLLRQQLEGTLITNSDTSTPINKEEKGQPTSQTPNSKKPRPESNHSVTSLAPRGIMKKIMNRVSPNPSPVSSDAELESTLETTIPPSTPKKNRLSNKRRKRKPSPQSGKLSDNEVTKDRSHTVPAGDSSKSTPKFNSLDNRKSAKYLFKKNNEPSSDSKLHIPKIQGGSHTLDRPRKLKEQKTKGGIQLSKDDLDLRFGETLMDKTKKIRLSMKRPKALKPKVEQKKIHSNSKDKLHGPGNSKVKEWERMKKKQNKFTNYFGKRLDEIVPADGGCPAFVLKALKHVEANGMQSEGIYRMSGNKNDVESIMEKFDNNQEISLQELGVSVHAVTGALKNFFKLLPEPLIPYEFGKEINAIMGIMDAEERLAKLRDLVNQFPRVNLIVFQRLMYHLNRISNCKQNKMDTRNLQVVLYPTLLRPDFQSLQNISQNMNMGLFIQTCIEQSEHVFDIKGDDMESLPGMVEAPSSSSLAQSSNDLLDDSVSVGGGGGGGGGSKLKRLSSISVVLNDGVDDMNAQNGTDITSQGNEPSFSESVLHDPTVEIIISSPSQGKVMRKASINSTSSNISTSSKTEKRKSIETTI